MHSVTVDIQEAGWDSALDDAAECCRNAARTVLDEEQAEASEMTVLLTNDEAVQQMNAKFRGKDKSTNVLSFPNGEQVGETTYLGDIAVAFETCQQEAIEQQKPLQHHLTHLVIHATLHLLGYNHIEDEEAEWMEGREVALLSKHGIADPYQAAEEH